MAIVRRYYSCEYLQLALSFEVKQYLVRLFSMIFIRIWLYFSEICIQLWNMFMEFLKYVTIEPYIGFINILLFVAES